MMATIFSLIKDSLVIFGLALAIDLIFGEIPDKVHPTVWIGKVISYFKPKLKNNKEKLEKINGIILCCGIIFIFAVPAYLILFGIKTFFGWLPYILASALLLKSTIAIKCMAKYTLPIAEALNKGKKDEAKKWLHYIVSRKPDPLNEKQIISATVESIAESTTDGITSPLFYFAVFGVPGAIAFRSINTLDSMVGYKDRENQNIGWFSAKMDTLTNYIPARITAIMIILTSLLLHQNWKNSLKILQRDRNKTASPNAGWTMSAMAGTLNIQLEKKGVYTLGEGNNISQKDIPKALKIMGLTAILFGLTVVIPILLLKGIFL